MEIRECLLWLLYPPQGCDVEENIYILKAQYKLKPTTLNSKYSQILALYASNDFLRGNKLRHLLHSLLYKSIMGDIKALRRPFSQGRSGKQTPSRETSVSGTGRLISCTPCWSKEQPVTFAKAKASSYRAPLSIKWDD